MAFCNAGICCRSSAGSRANLPREATDRLPLLLVANRVRIARADAGVAEPEAMVQIAGRLIQPGLGVGEFRLLDAQVERGDARFRRRRRDVAQSLLDPPRVRIERGIHGRQRLSHIRRLRLEVGEIQGLRQVLVPPHGTLQEKAARFGQQRFVIAGNDPLGEIRQAGHS